MKFECAVVFLYLAFAHVVHADTPLFHQGLQYESAGKWQEAYDAYRSSLDAGEEIPNSNWDAAYRAVRIGCERLGKLEEALKLADHELERKQVVGFYMLVGDMYRERLKQYDRARDYYHRGVDLGLKQGRHLWVAMGYKNIGETYNEESYNAEYFRRVKITKPNLHQAEFYLQKALAMCDQVKDGEGDANNVRRVALRELSDIYNQKAYSDLYNPKLAQELDEKAEALGSFSKTDQRVNDTFARVNKCISDKKYDEAIALMEAEIAKFRPSILKIMMYDRVRDACEQKGDLPAALDAIRHSIDCLNVVRANLKTDAEKNALQKDYWYNAVYGRGLDLTTRLKRSDEALEIMDMSKARAMLDWMGGQAAAASATRTDKSVRERELLLAKADEIRKSIEREKKMGSTGHTESLQRSLVLVEDQSERLKANIENLTREVQSTTNINALTAAEIKEVVGPATLIEISEDIYVAVTSGGKTTAFEMRRRGRMREQLKKFLATMLPDASARGLDIEGGKNAAVPPADFLAPAQELYNLLIRPIESQLKTDRIYIVVDRSLANLPFQALHDGTNYFGEKHTIVYEPSVSVLKYCIARRKPAGARLVAFGNPNLQDPRFRLAYAEEEVKSLAALYPEARVLMGDDASESAVALLGNDADILHFACHAELNPDDPLLSSLRLSPDRDNDGFLHTAEIFRLNLSAGLVTLSACESLKGRESYGKEMLGLPRALMFAGVPSVLGSLWRVDDRATAELMKHFYTGLKTKDKATALRDAQAQMIKAGYSPFYWAAFCLYGDYM